MKKLIQSIFILILGVLFLSVPDNVYAQKKKPHSISRHRTTRVTRLPSGFKTLVHGKAKYFAHNGVFYRRANRGYVIVHPPVGLRIRSLPPGYLSFRFGNLMYYHYYGTYYRYDPADEVYIVVNNPKEADETEKSTDFVWDEITLINGSVLKGLYLGGDSENIQFETDGKIRDIPVNKIISMNFAPVFEESGPNDTDPTD